MIELRRATRKAVEYACTHYHYSRCVPAITVAYNVYENNEWCGVIVYSSGATPRIGTMFGLVQGEILELVRVALNGKQSTTSECVGAALRLLHKECPQIKMVVSYADPEQGHVGTVYQATNWIYIGTTDEFSHSKKAQAFIVNGKRMHPKSVHSKGWKQQLRWLKENIDPNAQEIHSAPKHKYIFCFDKRLKKEWMKKAKPYPKKGGDSIGKRTEPSCSNPG